MKYKCRWNGGCSGRGSSLVAAAINQEAAAASVVLYQALCPDSRLASLSAPAPRTWLSTLPDPPDNMRREQAEKERSFKAGRQGRIVAITGNVSHLPSLPLLILSFSENSLLLFLKADNLSTKKSYGKNWGSLCIMKHAHAVKNGELVC